MLDHWVAVLAQMDVQKPQATAMLLKVETTIAVALPARRCGRRFRLRYSSSTELRTEGWNSTHS